MVRSRIRLIAAIALSIGIGTVAGGDTGPRDPRVGDADALLADAAGYERAIELYREVLRDEPDAAHVRLRLARVLAWSQRFEESLAHYDELLAGAEPPAESRVERAEVLSWSGRYDEAEREFGALLEADPDDARAARGLARVQRWSGRLGQADRSYQRALGLEYDAEAAQEHRRLRAGWRPWLRGSADYATDSEDFSWLRAGVETAFFRTASTTLRARTGYHRVAHSQRRVPIAAVASRSTDRATELGLGIDQSFRVAGTDGPLRLTLDAGVRLWQHADESLVARGELEFAPGESTVVGIEGHTGDHLDGSSSFEALQERLRASGGGLWFWQGLGPAWSLYGRTGLTWVEGGNRYHDASASLAFQPFATRAAPELAFVAPEARRLVPFLGTETRLHLDAGWTRYVHRSPFYYDPSSDLGLFLRATDRIALHDGLHISPSLGIGVGSARDGRRSSGLTYEATGELSYRRDLWLLSASGGRRQTRRASHYTYDHVLLSVTREFGAP